MDEHEQTDRREAPANTGVDEAREMPPGSRVGPADPGDRDEGAVREAEDQLGQAGGGH